MVGEILPPMNGWIWRQKITITSSVSLSNYPVMFTIIKGGTSSNDVIGVSVLNLKNDFSDIRFTASDGTTALKHWIRNDLLTLPTNNAEVWVKIPSLPIGTTTIYLYYGNPSASDSSDPVNVFDFFDHFPGTAFDATKWTWQSQSYGAINVANSILSFTWSSAPTWITAYAGAYNMPRGVNTFILASFKPTYIANSNAGAGIGWDAGWEGHAQAFFASRSTLSTINMRLDNGSKRSSPTVATTTLTTAAFNRIKLSRFTGDLRLKINNESEISYASYSTYLHSETINTVMVSDRPGSTVYCDWYALGQIVNTPPTFVCDAPVSNLIRGTTYTPNRKSMQLRRPLC